MMKKTSTLFIFFLFLLNFNLKAQVKIILDTDFGLSGDDLGALAMLHFYIDQQECEVLGIINATTDSFAVHAIDAINRFYFHPDIPIGTRKNKITVEKDFFNRAIAEKFPNKIDYNSTPEAAELYRRILASQPDKSVTLVIISPMLNIQQLLQSKPDTFSPLNGMELVQQKVKEAVIMGGIFPTGENEWNFSADGKNVTRFVVENLKVPLVFTGFELGEQIKTAEILNTSDKNTPLYQGFLFYSEHAPWMKENFTEKIQPNSSFDQTAVLYAVRGGVSDYWEKISGGYCEVDENGDDRWIAGKVTNQAYLKLLKSGAEIAKVIDAAMLHKNK